MSYLSKIPIPENAACTAEISGNDIEKRDSVLYVTDDPGAARRLRDAGEAVLIYLHEGNSEQDFSGFLYAVEDPENLDPEYALKVYQRMKGLPWEIMQTKRCLIRETTPEDVEDFFRIYSDPAITRYMENLYPEMEQEKQYIREYIEKFYTFYEFGVWTVVERQSCAVIGRAGFALREGYEEPELGFIIGVPWQHRGYAEEVCGAILQYGWERLEFQKVQAMVEPGNEASLKLCEKLGFEVKETVEVEGKRYLRLMAEKVKKM